MRPKKPSTPRASSPSVPSSGPSLATRPGGLGCAGAASSRRAAVDSKIAQQLHRVRRIALVAYLQGRTRLRQASQQRPNRSDPGMQRMRPIADQCPAPGDRQSVELLVDLRHRRQRPIAVQDQPPSLALSLQRHCIHRYMLAGMQHSDPLLQILILLAASVCVVAAVRKLALPAILGYLAVGMLLGPHALALGGRQRHDAPAGRLRRGIPGVHARAGFLAAAPGRHALGGARRRRRPGA